MSFVKWIEEFDSKWGIPRPAEFQHLPPFHAFMRIMQHITLVLALFCCGIVSSYLLWISAGFLQVSYQTRLYFIIGILLVLFVALMEACREIIPYYRIRQRLTYGTARWADEVYLRNTGLALKVGPSLEGLPKGSIRIGDLKKGYRLVLPETEWLRHLAIFGPPGSGKSTTFLMNMLRDVSRGGSAIVLDPKGELYEQTAPYFNQVYRLDLLNPECSDRWNFVPDCKNDSEFASQMAATMIGLEGTKHSVADPFWQESELLLLTAVLLHLPDVVPEPTPPMIYEYLGMRDMKAIDGEMSDSDNQAVRLAWGAFKKAPPQTQGSVITGLMNKLQAFEIKNAQAVCAPVSESDYLAGVRQINFRKLRRPGTAIYVVVAEGDATRYKNVLSTFFGQAVNQLRLDRRDKNPAPVTFCLDEAANVPIVGLKEIAGVGRGRRIGLILGYQNMPQVQDQYGHDGANAILGSVGTMIFLPGLDDATSQYASRRIGQTTSWSRTTIDAHGRSMDSERQSETGRALMDPTELRQMVKHSQCVVIIDTSPPIKAGYPEFAVRRERALATDFGAPRLVSLLEAEERVMIQRALSMREGELAGVLENGEIAVENDSSEQLAAGVYRFGDNGSGKIAEDSVYQEMFERLKKGELPEDCETEKQTPLAHILKMSYDSDRIHSWEDVREFDIKTRYHVISSKESVPAIAIDEGSDTVVINNGKEKVAVSSVAGLASAPKVTSPSVSTQPVVEGSAKKPEQAYLFYSNQAVEDAFVDSADAVVKNGSGSGPSCKPVLSTALLEKGAVGDRARPGEQVDALR